MDRQVTLTPSQPEPTLPTPVELDGDIGARERLNSDLADALAESILIPESAWSLVRQVLQGYGYDLPYALLDIQGADGEDVYGLTDTLFVYFAFFQSETGWYECFAEVLTEDELRGVMEESDSD